MKTKPLIQLPYEFFSTDGHEEILKWFRDNGFQTVKLYGCEDVKKYYTDLDGE